MSIASIDTHLLLRVVYTSLIAGIGVSAVFSVAVYGLIRSGEMRREQRGGSAVSYALLGVTGLVLAIALVAAGLVLLTRKS